MNDRILDVCLEEALGGAQPPDVTDRVVRALRDATSASRNKDASVGENSVGPVPAAAPRPILVAPALRDGESHSPLASVSLSRSTSAAFPRWLPLALAASLLVAFVGYWTLGRSKLGKPAVAKQLQKRPGSQGIAPATDLANNNRSTDEKDGDGDVPSPQVGSQAPLVADNEGHRERSRDDEPLRTSNSIDEKETQPHLVGSVAKRDDMPPASELDSSTAGNAIAASSLENALSSSATTDAQVIAAINAALKQRWKDAGIRPSPAATESEWCRRVYLDCIGRIPTVEELEAFLVDNRRDKRARLVERLLESDQYVESYARFWTTLWTNLLIGRTGGMEPNSPVYRAGLEQYLRRAFLQNKPFNQFVYELISAQGANRPGEDDYNGAVNFLLAHLQEKATPATAKTAQIFLGLQLQCTQCHNHPFNKWQQNRFWELNAFFRQAHLEREMSGNQLKAVRLLDVDFAGEGGDPTEAEVYFELRNGIMQVAYPTFVDGQAIDPNGLVSVVDRRRELARMVSRSDELKLAIVNRLWAHFLGYGFTKPVDDLGPHNPPSHPELLARLADEFAGHGYDLKRLVRWITLSDAYGLSSKFGPKLGNAADDPTTGSQPLFSHFYLRQMSAEQLYDSLLVATGAHRTQGNYEEQQQLKDRWLEQFAIAFGTDENDEATTFDGTIAQTLVMMNGELTRKATNGDSGSFLSEVSLKSERAGALNELYLAALARRPSRGEVQVANNLLTAQAGNATTALEDIWWALLNSNEFILNH